LSTLTKGNGENSPEKMDAFKEVMTEIMKIANELLNNRK
jgi:hypothetical protein